MTVGELMEKLKWHSEDSEVKFVSVTGGGVEQGFRDVPSSDQEIDSVEEQYDEVTKKTTVYLVEVI